MLKVFYADISRLPEEPEGLPLSDYRLSRLKKIRVALKRKQSIGAELLLNHALKSIFPGKIPPFKVKADSLGKPFIDELPVYFSLSHSGIFSACAVSDEPVGLDIEENRRYDPALARRFFTAEEQKLLEAASDKDGEFCRIWTGKESVLKLLGTGLARPLSSVHIKQGPVATIEPENLELNLRNWAIDGFAISVCTRKPEADVTPLLVEI